VVIENGVVIDTQGTTPEGSTSEQAGQSEAKGTDTAQSMSETFAQVKAELSGDKKPEDTEKPATDQPEPTKGTTEPEPKRFKYKSHEDAEKANQEAARKITELSEKLARYERGESPAKKPDTQPPTDEEGNDDEQGDDAELPELSDEEYAELARTDPLAARRYDQLAFERKMNEKLSPLLQKQEQEALAAQEAKEILLLESIEKQYDSDFGKGTADRLQKQISDPNTLKEIIENSPLKDVIDALVQSGDKVKTLSLLMREAHLYNARADANKSRMSIPSSTGEGVSTRRTSAKINDMSDAFRAAKEELR